MKKQTVVEDRERAYELYRAEDESLYLNVVCGGVAQFERTIKLSSKDMQMYQEWGKSYLDDLAYKISRAPDQYRHVTI